MGGLKPLYSQMEAVLAHKSMAYAVHCHKHLVNLHMNGVSKLVSRKVVYHMMNALLRPYFAVQ